MPSLLGPSPLLIDQTFPRNEYDLRVVATALGEMQGIAEEGSVHLVVTETLRTFITDFDWSRPELNGLLLDIYHLLNLLFSQDHFYLVQANVAHIDAEEAHPIPRGTEENGLVEFWADDMGKLLSLHDQECRPEEFFIGIACPYAFAGQEKGEYDNPDGRRVFPLVGPGDLNRLENAYEYEVPHDIHRRLVTFAEAKKNLKVIGGDVRKPNGSSHYMAHFVGARSWPLDMHFDELPDFYVEELEEITGYSLNVIKVALTTGKLPATRIRIPTI